MKNQESRFGINIGPFVICRRKQLEDKLIRAEEKAFKRIYTEVGRLVLESARFRWRRSRIIGASTEELSRTRHSNFCQPPTRRTCQSSLPVMLAYAATKLRLLGSMLRYHIQ